jgi:argininosuccinate synthase
MRLYKGNARAVARQSPNALYDSELAGFGESGGLFSQQASPGFIGDPTTTPLGTAAEPEAARLRV